LLASSREAPPKSAYTPLHAAAWQGHEAAVAALLVYRADVRAADSDGATPLHKAAWRGHLAAVRLLLAAGAPRDAKDNSGQTPLALARSRVKETGPIDRSKFRSWGPEQAIGEPNTPTAGDQPTAWASQTADGQDEWLLLTFGRAVRPSAVEVYESYSPGALERVTVFDARGKESEVWKGADPTPATSGMGTSKIKVTADVTTRRVKIYLASTKVPGWNEIDAVALVDADGGRQWAEAVEASSDYAGGEPPVSAHVQVVRALEE
jgi:hypothetical protein